MKTRIAVSFAAAVLTGLSFCFLAWAAGFNFDHRGDAVGIGAAYGLIGSFGAGVMTFLFPGWEDYK